MNRGMICLIFINLLKNNQGEQCRESDGVHPQKSDHRIWKSWVRTSVGTIQTVFQNLLLTDSHLFQINEGECEYPK